MAGTESAIRKMLTDIAGIAPDVPSTGNLYLDLGVASVHAMQLLCSLEDQFGVSIPDEDFVEATSIAKITEMIQGLLKNAGSAGE